MPVIEYSSMCLNQENYKDKIKEAKKIVESNGFDFGIQLHNSVSKELFNKIIEYRDEIEISVHSPVFSEYFLNLADPDFERTKKTCDENIKYLRQVGTNIFFFHGLFLTEKPILHDMANYRKTIRQGIGDEFCLNGSFVMDPKVFKSPIFEKFKNQFIINYYKVKKLYPDFVIALENDFVGIGSGLQRPQEILELMENIWFDLGHFWCSSLLHEFDFYESCTEIIEKKKIVGVHINHNFMTKETPKEKISDSHGHIYEKSEQTLQPVIKKLIEKGVLIFTLEILEGNINDVTTLLDWINS